MVDAIAEEQAATVPQPVMNWNYIPDDAITSAKISTTIDSLTTKIFNKDAQPEDIFYEILISAIEFPERLEIADLIKLINSICNNIPDVKRKEELAIIFLVVLNSFTFHEKFPYIAQQFKCDLKLKREYLDNDILLKSGYMTDYNKIMFNYIRKNELYYQSFSSLTESSEGYSKFTVEVLAMMTDSYVDAKINYYVDVIERLIARFHLNPTRCFLLFINLFGASDLQSIELLLQIIRKSMWNMKDNKALSEMLALYVYEFSAREKIKELRLITALIKEGIIGFNIIYNSLTPRSDEEEETYTRLYETYKEDKEKKFLLATASALALAAPLIMDDDDDDYPSGGANNRSRAATTLKDTSSQGINKAESEKGINKELAKPKKIYHDQKSQFLVHLLELGMYNESLFILAQNPVCPLFNDQVSKDINRVMDVIIDPYYCEFAKPTNWSALGVISGVAKDSSSSFPQVTNKEELFKVSNEFLKLNQFRVAENVILFTKLIRIIKKSLFVNRNENEDDEEEKRQWLQYYRTFIFPYLPILVNNFSVVDEAFSILKDYFSLETRYNLYGEFQAVTIKQNLEIKSINSQTEKQTKDVLKRLSHTNSSEMMRKLAKVSYSNPLSCSNVFLQQIENYDNLSDLIVDSSRFFNNFGWDSLSFQICNRLTSNRSSMQDDGIHYTQWLQNLSNFIGKISRQQYDNIHLEPVLTLIYKSLFQNQTDFVILLNELVTSMSGIKDIQQLSLRQIEMLNGEESLKRLVYLVIGDTRLQSKTQSAALIRSLTKVDSDGQTLLPQFLILLCHLTDFVSFNSEQPLKILSQRIDELSSLLYMYITLMDETMSVANLKKFMIPAPELIDDYDVPPRWVFQVWRRSWTHAIKEIMQLEIEEETDSFATFQSETFEPLCDSLKSKVDFEILSPGLYFTFWQLTLNDINYNKLDYAAEHVKVRDNLLGLSKSIRQAESNKDFPSKQLRRMKEEKKEMELVLDKVLGDSKIHGDNDTLIMKYINKEKDNWIKLTGDQEEGHLQKVNDMIMEHCILPRVVHSSFDATYTYRFLFLMLRLNVENFSLIMLLDNLFQRSNLVQQTFAILTNSQADNFGLFYGLVLSELNSWWKDEKLYMSEALGVMSKAESKADEDVEMKDADPVEEIKFNISGMVPPDSKKALDFKLYKRVLFNWHSSLLSTLSQALSSSQYSTVNNAIICLKNLRLRGVFPIVQDHSELILHKLQALTKRDDDRQDLILAANALIALLTSKKSELIPMWDFFDMTENELKAQKAKREKIEARERAIKQANEEAAHAKQQLQASKAVAEANKDTSSKPYGLVGLAKKPAVVTSASSNARASPDSTAASAASKTPSAPATTPSNIPSGPGSRVQAPLGPKLSTPSARSPATSGSATPAKLEAPVAAAAAASAASAAASASASDLDKSQVEPAKSKEETSVGDLLRQKLEAEKQKARQLANSTNASSLTTPAKPTSRSLPANPASSNTKPNSNANSNLNTPLPPPPAPPPPANDRRQHHQRPARPNSGAGGSGANNGPHGYDNRERSRYGGREPNSRYTKDRYIPSNKRSYEYDNGGNGNGSGNNGGNARKRSKY